MNGGWGKGGGGGHPLPRKNYPQKAQPYQGLGNLEEEISNLFPKKMETVFKKLK